MNKHQCPRIQQHSEDRTTLGFIVIISAMVVSFITIGITGALPNYSEGSRVGIVTKLSRKGAILKSWEGEMLMSLPTGNNIAPEKFEFSLPDGESPALAKVRAAMQSGGRVEITYRQWLARPARLDTGYVVTTVK